jgi:4-alpha-glucanotransferase
VDIVAAALEALEAESLLLGIPDRSLPSATDEDTGAGALDTHAGHRFLAHARALGFTGIQLGPQGESSAGNPSPYDGTLFSRGRIALAASRLAEPAWGRLLEPATVERLVAERPADDPTRIAYAYAHAAHGEALSIAYEAFVARRAAADPAVADVAVALDAFMRRAAAWLVPDALYDVLGDAGRDTSWSAWRAREPALRAQHVGAIERYAFTQLVLHEQHRVARAQARALGLAVWGDLQVGISARDAWRNAALFLDGYRLGAPPSRTNPEGQPWGYPVFDPAHGADVERFLGERLEKTFDEYDGVRLDHPHGLVCPWVYQADTGDDVSAVRDGARLRASPDVPGHPALARFAIPRAGQLNPDPGTRRYDDAWVVELEPAQVARYANLMGTVVAAAHRYGRDVGAIACEVLSTCPYPLRRVLEHHGLGRFRVTQKANLDDPRDGYRSEHAEPPDWIMVGNHDTPTIWTVADGWDRTGSLRPRAEYLAWRLAPNAAERDALCAELAASPARLVHAQFADLFASRARHVLVFFHDAFGLRDPYNRGGTVADDNWVLRLPADYDVRQRARLATDEALNLPLALAMALRARGAEGDGDRRALLRRLEAAAVAWRQGALPR